MGWSSYKHKHIIRAHLGAAMNDPVVAGLIAYTVILLGFFATSAFIVWVLIQFALKMMSPRPKEEHEPPHS